MITPGSGALFAQLSDFRLTVTPEGTDETAYQSKDGLVGLKNFDAGIKGNKSTSMTGWSWHGEDLKNGTTAKDGVYDYKITMRPDVIWRGYTDDGL